MAKAKSPAGGIAGALATGDGMTFLRLIATKQSDDIRRIGQRVDVSRWDVRQGRALLLANDWLLALSDEDARDYLPALAIAAARETQYKSAAKQAQATRVVEKLGPYVERSEWVADLVARSGCHFIRVYEGIEEAKVLYGLAKRCKAIARNEYLIKLKKAVG